MPFRTLFRSEKKMKKSTKRAAHFSSKHQLRAADEPPDGGQYEPVSRLPIEKNSQSNCNGSDSHSSTGSLPPSLYRAATAPLPVLSHSPSVSGARQMRKSSSLGGSLDSHLSPELTLHDRRLRDLTQLESYISYLQHTFDDDVSSRLCCAQVLKTLYMRHEEPYVNLLCRNSRLSRKPKTLTNPSGKPKDSGVCSTAWDGCSPPDSDDDHLAFLSDPKYGGDKPEKASQHGALRSALKKSSLGDEHVSHFCRQTGSRIPVVGRRHSPRVSLPLTPMVRSPSPGCCDLALHLNGPEEDLCERMDRTRKGSLEEVTSDSTESVSSGEGEVRSLCTSRAEMTRCRSDWTLTPFATISMFPESHEIY